VCGQSDFILDCISPPPSPPSPPPSPAAPSPGRPISALEAAIGIDPETRPIFAASALAAFSVGFLLFLAFFVSPPAAAAPPPPDEEEEEADAAAAGGEGNGSSLLAGARGVERRDAGGCRELLSMGTVSELSCVGAVRSDEAGRRPPRFPPPTPVPVWI